MSLSVNLSISRTHLLARKKQTMVAMLGVTFGIAMFILMISFMEGVNQFLQDTMLSSTPDIHIYNDLKTDYTSSVTKDYFRDNNKLIVVRHPKPKQVRLNLKNAEGIIASLKSDSRITAISPELSTQVFYNYGPVQINGFIDGVNIMQEARLYDLAGKITEGRLQNLLTTTNGLIMGSGLAAKLNTHTGDLVTLTTPYGSTMRFRVVGLFTIGISAIDDVKGYVNLTTVQQLMGKDRSYITDINIKLNNNEAAVPIATALSKMTGYKADDWQTANSSVMASNLIRNVLTYVVSVTLLIVAGFGIYNIMNMTIANKMKDIAILKAQGFERKDIIEIFLSQSVVIGCLGALLGILLGFILSYILSRMPFPESQFVALKYYPVVFRPLYYLFGFMFGVSTTFLAGLMPSVKAAKIDPVIILRG